MNTDRRVIDYDADCCYSHHPTTIHYYSILLVVVVMVNRRWNEQRHKVPNGPCLFTALVLLSKLFYRALIKIWFIVVQQHNTRLRWLACAVLSSLFIIVVNTHNDKYEAELEGLPPNFLTSLDRPTQYTDKSHDGHLLTLTAKTQKANSSHLIMGVAGGWGIFTAIMLIMSTSNISRRQILCVWHAENDWRHIHFWWRWRWYGNKRTERN